MEPVAIVQVPDPPVVALAEAVAAAEADGDGEASFRADGVERKPEKKYA